MHRLSRFALVLLLLGATLLGGAGAYAAWREFGVFAGGGITDGSRFEALAAGEHRRAASPLADRLLLAACDDALRGLYGRLRPTAERRAVATTCRDAADAITARSPADAYAFLVGAVAADALGDAGGRERRLLQSYRTGPMAQWVAEQRVALVEPNYAEAGAELRARHAADLELLVRSRRGILSVSHRYVADPGFRARITDIVEALPEEDQARFVRTVRQAAAAPAGRGQ